jgi:hypothetical protein
MKKSILFIILFILQNAVFCQDLLWAKKLGGLYSDAPLEIATDNDGNVYTTGVFDGTADFDPNIGVFNLTSLGGQDIFISKLDADGNFVWAKSYGSKNEDWGCVSIKCSKSGNIAVCGFFKDTISFDTKEGTREFISNQGMGGYNTFILKLDSKGNIDWAKQIENWSFPPNNSIIFDDKENVYLTGLFSRIVDFDLGNGTYNLTPNTFNGNAFVLKLNSDGDFVWAKKLGARIGFGIGVDKFGNVITVGRMTNGISDFDPNEDVYNLSPKGYNDVYLSKLDSMGNFVWAKQIGGIGNEEVGTIKLDKENNYYIYGTFERTVDFNLDSVGVYNLTAPINKTYNYVAKYNSNAELIWVKKYDENVKISGLDIDPFNNVYLVGKLISSTDLDPNEGETILNGSWGFASKLNSNGKLLWAKRIGGINPNSYYSNITVEKTGGVYITSRFQGTINLDSTVSGFILTSSSDSLDVLVFKIKGCIPLTDSGYIIGPQSVCIGTKAFYTLQSPNKESDYTWNLPTGATLISGQNTKTIQVRYGDSSGYISVSQINTCSSLPPFVHSIQVRSLQAPIVGTQITPSSNVCKKTAVKVYGTGAKYYSISDSIIEGFAFVLDTTKTFTILGTDTNGCFNIDTFSVQIKSLPKLSAIVSPSTNVCKLTPITLSAKGANKYIWNNNIINGIPFKATQSQYTLIGTDSVTNCSDTFIQNITIKPLPIIVIKVTPSNSICIGNTLMFTASGAVKYVWNNGVKQNTYFYPTPDKKYLVVATDSNNCTDTTNIDITFKSLPVIDISAYPSDSVCKGETIILKGKGAKYYNWDNGILDSVKFTPIDSKTYTLTGTDSNGCKSKKPIQITVNALPNIVSQPVNQFLKIGNDAHFSIKCLEQIKSYQWQQHLNDSFINLSNTEFYSGTTSEKLTVKQFKFNQHNFKYRCIISNGTCNSKSEEVLIGVDSSSIKNSITKDGFVVYPNPVYDILTIQGDNSIIGLTYSITDDSGKLILSSTISNEITKINVEKFSQGIYMVFLNDKYLKTYKVLKL